GVWQVAADRAERVARGDGAQSACRVRRAEQGSAAARDRAAQAAREDRDAEVAALVARGFPLGSRLPFRRPPMPATTLAPPDVQQLIETRRDFHAHPELAFEETRTSSIVTDRLRALGLTPATGIGKTGVVAIVEGGKPGKTVLLRADMDALPIQEENDTPYRSQNPGKMHACGHDCHTSILLGVAKQLVERKSSLGGRIKLCFQPAEEVGGGANSMIEDGALRDPKPDAAFGLHVWQDLDLGKVGVTAGPM